MLEVRVTFVWYEWLFVPGVPAALVVWSCIVWQGGGEVVGVARVVSKYLPGRGAALGAEALYDMQKASGKWRQVVCEARPARDGMGCVRDGSAA